MDFIKYILIELHWWGDVRIQLARKIEQRELFPDTTTFLVSREGDLESFLTRDGDFDSFLAREGDLDFALLVVLVTLIGWEISLWLLDFG